MGQKCMPTYNSKRFQCLQGQSQAKTASDFQALFGCGNGIFRGIEERACGNLGGQLKKKWDIQDCSRKTSGISVDLGFWLWKFQGV